jgi:hypothetical protein
VGAFSLDVMVCIPLFMQFVKRGSYWFQMGISNKLHDHSFSNIISKMDFDLHHAHLKS